MKEGRVEDWREGGEVGIEEERKEARKESSNRGRNRGKKKKIEKSYPREQLIISSHFLTQHK